MRPAPASPARGHTDMAFTSQWFYFHKDLRKTIPDIFIVYPFGLSRPSRNRCAHFSDQLLIGFVHTHDGIVCVIRQMINTENVLHCCYKGRILLWWDFPIFAAVRFKFAFFKIRCAVMWETEGAKLSSTALLARSLTVHRAWPSGASEQAKAVKRASNSPSKTTGCGGISPFLRSRAALIPSSGCHGYTSFFKIRKFKCYIVLVEAHGPYVLAHKSIAQAVLIWITASAVVPLSTQSRNHCNQWEQEQK